MAWNSKEEYMAWKDAKKTAQPSHLHLVTAPEPLLMKCEACGAQVSIRAMACPHCGEPSRDAIANELAKDMAKPRCPKCQSASLAASRKGFSWAWGILGSFVITPLLAIPVGLLDRNVILLTCMQCGHQWKAGDPEQGVVERRDVIKGLAVLIGFFAFYVVVKYWLIPVLMAQ